MAVPQSWPQLRCVQHCDGGANIICLSVPPVCPLCGRDTNSSPMRIPPYVLPTPFLSSAKAPCSLVLKPTVGDFVGNYTCAGDLHIGVTDSNGRCHDFDQTGLHVGSVWPQCIAIAMVTVAQSERLEGMSASHWDQCLAQFADPAVWQARSYCEESANCFDFVLRFLAYCRLQGRLEPRLLASKKVFCDHFLQQETSKAARFVNLYRQVLKHGFVLDRKS